MLFTGILRSSAVCEYIYPYKGNRNSGASFMQTLDIPNLSLRIAITLWKGGYKLLFFVTKTCGQCFVLIFLVCYNRLAFPFSTIQWEVV